MKLSVSVGVLALSMVAGSAMAQPYYVRGDFNGWSGTGSQLVDQGGGKFSATISGLAPGSAHEFKCTTDDWGFNGPNDNAKVVANASGNILVNFFPATSWSDGWQPSDTRRVGFVDSGIHGWDIMGSLNGWSSPLATMTDLGNGLYKATILTAPGSFDMKFRKAGDWNVAVGRDFSNYNNNITINVGAGDTGVDLFLDLPNGRWQALAIPTPGALGLLGMAGVVAGRRRR